MYVSDLGSSLFLEDLFLWDNFHEQAKDSVGQFFMLKRIKRLKLKHRSLLLDWLVFIEQGDSGKLGMKGHLNLVS